MAIQTNVDMLAGARVLDPATLSQQEIDLINSLSQEEIDILRSGAKLEPHEDGDHRFPKVVF